MTSDELQRLADLYARADANKKRSRRALVISVAAAAVVIVVLIGAIKAQSLAQDNRDLLRGQTTSLEKVNEIVIGLQQAEAQRANTSKNQALAFAVVLENLAAAFATPPAPDPARLRAVQGLCGTAASFRAAAGDDKPPPCPAP